MDTFFSRKTENIVRGMAALVIMYCHLHIKGIGENSLFSVFFNKGSLMVAIFWMFSGYNLTISYFEQDSFDLKHFVIKKMCSLLIPFWLSNLLLYIFFVVIGDNIDVDIKTIIRYVLGFEHINSSAWYVVALTILLTLYTLIISILYLVKNKVKIKYRSLYFLMVCLILYIYSLIVAPINRYYHLGDNFPVTFLLGVICATYHKELSIIINRYRVSFLFVLSVLYLIVNKIEIRYGCIVASKDMMLKVLFTCIICVLICGKELKSTFFTFFGNYSYEIYLLQVFCLVLWRQKIWIKSDILFIVLYSSSLIGLSIAFNKINKLIRRRLLRN